MQRTGDSNILQTTDCQRQEGINPSTQRKATPRIPKSHRNAERKLIALVERGDLEIDNQGRIWRLSKRMGCRWHGVKTVKVARRRAENKTGRGYLQIRAMVEGKRVHGMASRLVWQYFFGNIPDNMCINHKNGIKDDNRLENLEIVTYSENMKHAFKHGLCNQDGERNPAAKLTNKQVIEIRELYAKGQHKQQDLASSFGVSFQTISKLVRGERRRTQGGPIDKTDHRHCASKRDPTTGRFVAILDTEV